MAKEFGLKEFFEEVMRILSNSGFTFSYNERIGDDNQSVEIGMAGRDRISK